MLSSSYTTYLNVDTAACLSIIKVKICDIHHYNKLCIYCIHNSVAAVLPNAHSFGTCIVIIPIYSHAQMR